MKRNQLAESTGYSVNSVRNDTFCNLGTCFGGLQSFFREGGPEAPSLGLGDRAGDASSLFLLEGHQTLLTSSSPRQQTVKQNQLNKHHQLQMLQTKFVGAPASLRSPNCTGQIEAPPPLPQHRTDASSKQSRQKQAMGVCNIKGGSRGSNADKDPQDMEQFIVQELNSMSLQERELVYEDLHGVAAPLEETDHLVQQKLDEMRHQIEKAPVKNAYNLILQHYQRSSRHQVDNGIASATASASISSLAESCCYVTDPTFRLMFLRAARFNVKDAAHRFIQHLEWKLSLFGVEKLMKRSIMLSDLDSDAVEAVQSGRFQLLSTRDSSGRAVIFDAMAYHRHLFRSVDSALKLYWYICMSALEEIETQRSGFVGIIYAVMTGVGGSDKYDDSMMILPNDVRDGDFFWRGSQLPTILPMRVEAAHFCFSDIRLLSLVRGMQMYMGRDIRVRLRIHEGNHIECFYKMMTFGLPVRAIPIDYNLPLSSAGSNGTNSTNACYGELKTTNHIKWLKRRTAKEEAFARGAAALGNAKPTSVASCAGVFSESNSANNNSFPNSAESAAPYGQDEYVPPLTSMIDLPSKFDVLLGRGKPMQQHYGNKLLQELVHQRYQEYNSMKGKGKKTEIAQQVVDYIMKENNGRFLKRSDSTGFWEVVSNSVALERVCHSFRTRRGCIVTTSTATTNGVRDETKKRMKISPS